MMSQSHVICRLCAGLALSCVFSGIPNAQLAAQEITGLQAAMALEEALVETVSSAEASIVAIARVRRNQRRAGNVATGHSSTDPTSTDFIPNEYGTGVIVGANGYIVTMAHVLGNVKENDYVVWHQRKPYQVAESGVLGVDPWTDLAVLKIAASDLKPITFGDAAKLKKGMVVVALGNPYAIARDGEVSASWGIISNLRRKAPPNDMTDDPAARAETLHHFGNLIQTDARLNLGTSGGALLNLKGEMIGLTTSLAAKTGYEKSAGYAIPVDETFRRVIRDLQEGRTPQFGFLGVAPEDLNIVERRRGKQGVRLARVVDGTPAKIKLQDNDVITHIDDEPIYEKSDLLRELSKRDVNAEVRLRFERGGVPSTGTVRLLKKYLPRDEHEHAGLWRGLRVDYATALPTSFLERDLDVDFTKSVAVIYVKQGSPAWRAGMRRGEFISQVAGRPVTTPEEFETALRRATGAIAVTMAGYKRERRIIEPLAMDAPAPTQ